MSVARSPRQPAEVQNARNVLGLERRQGCQDRAVVGGLGTYLANWRARVAGADDRALAALAEQVVAELDGYAELSATERSARIDRALGMLEAPPGSAHTAERGSSPSPRPRPRPDSDPLSLTERGGDAEPPGAQLDQPGGWSDDVQPSRGEGEALSPGGRGLGEGEPTIPPAVGSAKTTPKARAAAPPPETAIDDVKGVKAKEAGLYRRLGIATFGDLLHHYPTRYQTYPPAWPIADLIMQPIASVVGVVQGVEVSPIPRGRLHKIVATVADRTGRVTATWFRHGRFSPVQPGQPVALSGALTAYGRALNFDNPDWERDDGAPVHTRRMVPTYPLTSGLTDRAVREKVKWCVDAWADAVPDPLPGWVREEHGLLPLGAALRGMHFPDDEGQLQVARRRLAFDELFTIQLVVLRRKLQWQWAEAPALAGPREPLDALLRAQPWQLTGGQRRSLDDVLADIAKPSPMIRLVQGEVGSGKTAVAAAALFVAVCQGAQGSLMAPTEILAEQHFRNLIGFYEGAADELEAVGARVPRVGLLTGSIKGAERKAIYRAIADGEVDVLVGTQAVIQDAVEFRRLGLAVVDEQHRFGVKQRVALREKGGHPHVLVMTATPIPRTLALSLYGDLDLSLIDELPPGRQKVKTYLLAPDERDMAYEKIRREAQKGGQAFVICPLVEDSPHLEARAATAEYERLQQGDLAGPRLALLHGRMKPAEKDAVMRAFRDGEYDVLVTTAVVEVGVDIPNATVMLIEGAERFGLAQLHQFRGRVGRGSRPSVCLLLTGEASEGTSERLQVMADSDSGLALAEHDLRLRGPGDYFGVRQSGFPELKVATLDDAALVERARRAAERVLEYDADLALPQHAALAARVEAFRRRAGEPN